MALAYLLLLLGSAAAFPDWKMARDDSECRRSFSLSAPTSDRRIENCLKNPDIAKVADGFKGPEADKRLEISIQCDAKDMHMFTGGALDPDKFKSAYEVAVERRGYDASVKQGLNDCFSILQQPYQIVAYLRCVGDYC